MWSRLGCWEEPLGSQLLYWGYGWVTGASLRHQCLFVPADNEGLRPHIEPKNIQRPPAPPLQAPKQSHQDKPGTIRASSRGKGELQGEAWDHHAYAFEARTEVLGWAWDHHLHCACTLMMRGSTLMRSWTLLPLSIKHITWVHPTASVGQFRNRHHPNVTLV